MANENRDSLYGINLPRGAYGVTGRQFGISLEDENGKSPTDGAPMAIMTSAPGAIANSPENFIYTYGASLDSYLTLINATNLAQSKEDMSVSNIYKNGTVNADDNSLWTLVDTFEGQSQQIQFMVNKNTIEEQADTTSSNVFDFTLGGRGFGIRIPSMVGGWGRTIDGLPTDPQPTQDPAGRKNDDAHKLARETWKFGPLEVRWDYRKGTWSAYNELVADHENVGLGTWVFSTNQDNDQGFPFLRGRLQDVWWVRKANDRKDTDGKQQGLQTGEIMTHLEHRLFDKEEKGAAKLNTVFIIPHEEGTHDPCHKKGVEYDLNGELTGDGERIDVRTTVHFWKEKELDGPIKFGGKSSDLDICCRPTGGKFFIGEMVFLDENPEVCPKSTGGVVPPGGGIATVVTENEEPPCEWVPAIKIDECELVGNHFVKLVTNDYKLARRISQMCTTFTKYTSDIKTVIDGNSSNTVAAIECLNEELEKAAGVLEGLTVANTVAMQNRISALKADMQAALVQFAQTIQAALLACGCEVVVNAPTIGGNEGIQIATPSGGKVTIKECKLLTTDAPDLDCNDNCFGTRILGPCLDQKDVMVGECGATSTIDPNLTTQFGECQQHEGA